VIPQSWDPRPFSPGLLDRSLDNISLAGEVTEQMVKLLAAFLAGRPVSQIHSALRGLLPPFQAGLGEKWFARAQAVVAQVAKVNGYLDADLDLTTGGLRELISQLLPVTQWAALKLLRAADNAVLQELFDDPALLPELDAAIPPGHDRRNDLEDFLGTGFAHGRAGLDQRHVVPQRWPARPFSPGELSPDLSDLSGDGALTAAGAVKFAEVAGQRSDDSMISEPDPPQPRFPPRQEIKARRWLGGARASVVYHSLRYRAGDLASHLTLAQKEVLLEYLLADPGGYDEHGAALALLQASSPAELARLVSSNGLVSRLRAVFTPDHPLHDSLDQVIAELFGSRLAELTAGRLQPRDRPAGEFTPGLISPALADLGLGDDLTAERITRIAAELAALDHRDIIRALAARLSGLQLARAEWWLTRLREDMFAAQYEPGPAPVLAAVLPALDQVLDWARLGAAGRNASLTMLRYLTAIPRASTLALLMAGLNPPADAPTGFVPVLPGGQDFRVGLERALRRDVDHLETISYSPAEYRNANLVSWERIDRIAALAKKWTDEVVGHFRTAPAMVHGGPGGGNIYDVLIERDNRLSNLSEYGRTQLARQHLREFADGGLETISLVEEHHAMPAFDPQGRALNN
jgi:hypothetical protein